MTRQTCYTTSLGPILIGYDADAVVFLKLCDKMPAINEPSALSDLAAVQIQEYFDRKRTTFTFPIRPQGTDFQRNVWQQLCRIPYGETQTYSQIAAAIGKPAASRAVGLACNRNPIWIVIPCHRVIGKNAALTGYAGGLTVKQALLDLEKRQK